jgi:hypothetical protein
MNNRGRLRCIVLACFPLLLALSFAHAEERDHLQTTRNIESSFIGGIGSAHIAEGHYQPNLLIWHLGVDLRRYFSGLEKYAGSLSAFVEPQVNPSFYPDNNIEIGVGLGIQYRHPITQRLSGYLLGSTGPHWITLVTLNQTNGLLFANTVGCGLYYFLRENASLHFGYRFRHLSNAGLAEPNDGINANILTLGYALFF